MTDSAAARLAMVRSQLLPNKVTDERITAALANIPREKFVPKVVKGIAYMDDNVQIAPGRYLMEPMVFAKLLQAAEIAPSDVVLDVGCGTGYSSAVLGQLAGTVVALESDDDLAAKAGEQLSDLEVGNAAVVVGPLHEGYGAQGPYDVIFVEGAVEHIPQQLIDQLAEGGRLIAAVVSQGVGEVRVLSREENVIGSKSLFNVAIPVLEAFRKRPAFVF